MQTQSNQNLRKITNNFVECYFYRRAQTEHRKTCTSSSLALLTSTEKNSCRCNKHGQTSAKLFSILSDNYVRRKVTKSWIEAPNPEISDIDLPPLSWRAPHERKSVLRCNSTMSSGGSLEPFRKPPFPAGKLKQMEKAESGHLMPQIFRLKTEEKITRHLEQNRALTRHVTCLIIFCGFLSSKFTINRTKKKSNNGDIWTTLTFSLLRRKTCTLLPVKKVRPFMTKLWGGSWVVWDSLDHTCDSGGKLTKGISSWKELDCVLPCTCRRLWRWGFEEICTKFLSRRQGIASAIRRWQHPEKQKALSLTMCSTDMRDGREREAARC